MTNESKAIMVKASQGPKTILMPPILFNRLKILSVRTLDPQSYDKFTILNGRVMNTSLILSYLCHKVTLVQLREKLQKKQISTLFVGPFFRGIFFLILIFTNLWITAKYYPPFNCHYMLMALIVFRRGILTNLFGIFERIVAHLPLIYKMRPIFTRPLIQFDVFRKLSSFGIPGQLKKNSLGVLS